MPQHSRSHKSDDQIFAFCILPHLYTFHSFIAYISTSSDGHVHDMEMLKLILLIGKLQNYDFSITFVCADGETGLTKYHTEYFDKYISKYIPMLLC